MTPVIAGVVLMAVLVVLIAAVQWIARHGDETRERLFCPVRRRLATVTFRWLANGDRTDVVRCSVFGDRPITCGKACLAHPGPA